MARFRWVPRQGARVLLSPAQGAVAEMAGLPASVRGLAGLGYGLAFAFLALMVAFEVLGAGERVVFKSSSEAFSVPYPVMVASSVAFAVGWALALTGATDCHRRVFLPIVAMFALQLFILAGAMREGSVLAVVCLGGPVLLGVVGFHTLTARSPRWRAFTLWEFAGWLALMVLFVALLWRQGETPGGVATALQGSYSVLMLVMVPFWLLLGVDVIDVAVSLARPVVAALRRRLSPQALRALGCGGLLAQPLLACGLFALFQRFEVLSTIWMLDFFLALLLGAVAVALLALGRWSPRMAATFLALIVAGPLILWGCAAAALGTGELDEAALAATGLFPPVIVFALLMTYDVLTFGARFANVDGRVMPRAGRVLLYLGLALLVISASMFELSLLESPSGKRDTILQDIVNGALLLGLLLFGPLYVVWLAWQRPAHLIGEG